MNEKEARRTMSRWKYWYWYKGGRAKVQYSRKVTQVERYNALHGK